MYFFTLICIAGIAIFTIVLIKTDHLALEQAYAKRRKSVSIDSPPLELDASLLNEPGTDKTFVARDDDSGADEADVRNDRIHEQLIQIAFGSVAEFESKIYVAGTPCIMMIDVVHDHRNMSVISRMRSEESYSSHDTGINFTNNIWFKLKGISLDDWNVEKRFNHIHYATDDTKSASSTAHFGRLQFANAKNDGFIFYIAKGMSLFSSNLVQLLCLQWQNDLVEGDVNVQYIHIQVLDMSKKQILWLYKQVESFLSNLYNCTFVDSVNAITIYPFSTNEKQEKNYQLFRFSEKFTYPAEFLFLIDTDSQETDYDYSIQDYFIRTDYFASCQCFNYTSLGEPHIYGKLVRSENSDSVIVENSEQQIKIINVNNRSTLGDTLKDILYKFVSD